MCYLCNEKHAIELLVDGEWICVDCAYELIDVDQYFVDADAGSTTPCTL